MAYLINNNKFSVNTSSKTENPKEGTDVSTLAYWKPIYKIYQGDSDSKHYYTDWFSTPYSMQQVQFAETDGEIYLDAKLPVKYTYDSTSGELTSKDAGHKFKVYDEDEIIVKDQIPVKLDLTTKIKDQHKPQLVIESELPMTYTSSTDYPMDVNGIRSLRVNFHSENDINNNYPGFFYPELKVEFVNADDTVEKSFTVYLGYGQSCYYLIDNDTAESSLAFAMMVDDSWDDATKLESIINQIGKNKLETTVNKSHAKMSDSCTGLYITPFGTIYNGISTVLENDFLDVKTATKLRLTWLLNGGQAATNGVLDHVYDNTGNTTTTTAKLNTAGNSGFDYIPTAPFVNVSGEIISVMYSDDVLGYSKYANDTTGTSYSTYLFELKADFHSGMTGGSVADEPLKTVLADISYTVPTPIALKDEYPYAYEKSKDDVIKEVTKVTDTYPDLDRWLRCVAESKGSMTILKCYGNTDGKLVYPDYVNGTVSLLSGQPGKSSAHLITPLRFDYPKMFKSVADKKCFNDGCFHFRIRFASLPDNGDLVLAQFVGTTVGYDIASGKFYMTPSSIDGDTSKNRVYATDTVAKSYFTNTYGVAVDIAVDTYDSALYFNKHFIMWSGINGATFVPAVTADGEIAYSNPVISPKLDGARFADGYDVDDIFIDYTTHKPLF